MDYQHEHEWEVLRLGIQPDHMHLFIRSNPYTMSTEIARTIKGRSSHLLREEFLSLRKLPLCGHVQRSTAGNVGAETIQKYIERQSKV